MQWLKKEHRYIASMSFFGITRLANSAKRKKDEKCELFVFILTEYFKCLQIIQISTLFDPKSSIPQAIAYPYASPILQLRYHCLEFVMYFPPY